LSTIKANALSGATTDSNLALTGNGSGVVTIGDGNLKFPDADGSSGEFIKTDGSAQLSFAEAGGGAWNMIGTAVASTSASLTITGLSSTYDSYAIAIADLVPSTDSTILYFRMGDSSGVDSGASDYAWVMSGYADVNNEGQLAGDRGEIDNLDSQIQISGEASVSFAQIGSGAGEGYGGMFFLNRPGDGSMQPSISGQAGYSNTNTRFTAMNSFGVRLSSITLDRIQIIMNSGNIASGRLTVWGISHA